MWNQPGDERPCQRCIKRGLADACQDGVRKKAKYLHDAPDGALTVGAGGNFYKQDAAQRNSSTYPSNGNLNTIKFQQSSNNFYPAQDLSVNTSQLSQPIMDNSIVQSAFTAPSPMSPTFPLSAPAQSTSLSQPPLTAVSSASNAPSQGSYGGAFFDPSDPALFNFDLASMNFGNRYGALEFGMLGHMATGVGDTPPSDTATQHGVRQRSTSQQFSTSGFGDSPGNQQSLMFGEANLNEWPAGQTSNPMNVSGLYVATSNTHMMSAPFLKNDGPHAFAIETGSATFASPPSMTSPEQPPNLEDSKSRPVISTPYMRAQTLPLKRRHRDPSTIYNSVREPYSYTNKFHKLTAFIQRRFPPQRTLRIAKALASIRPSFIATTRTLTRDDLIFMEKCFQRTLWEYEDFINACGTPTIVCRRTGEVAAVGKEFSILTGWKKDILLGKEPNMNVNSGGSTSSNSSSRGSFTPRGGLPDGSASSSGLPQSVFLAELLDDDSVIEFYEDFARLAFGDSRGSVMKTCKVLKYKTKEDMDLAKPDDSRWNTHVSKGGIAGEAGMNRLGFKDGKVDCSYCWTVKRDVFNIPMLIVMNVSFFRFRCKSQNPPCHVAC